MPGSGTVAASIAGRRDIVELDDRGGVEASAPACCASDLRSVEWVGEIENRYGLCGQPGKIKVTDFLIRGRMRSDQDRSQASEGLCRVLPLAVLDRKDRYYESGQCGLWVDDVRCVQVTDHNGGTVRRLQPDFAGSGNAMAESAESNQEDRR